MTSSTDRPIPSRIAFILLWLFVFTIPMTQATEIPMVGAISSAAGLVAIASCAIAVAARRKVRMLGPVHMAMAGFILWSAISLCWGSAADLAMQRIMTYLQLFVLVLLVWEICVEDKDILRLLSAFVLGTILPALSTMLGFLPGQQGILQRASAPGYDANQLAFLLALSVPAAYYLILREKGPITSLYRLQMGFAVCAILLTGSPGSMLAAAVGLSLVCRTSLTWSKRARVNVLLMALAGLLIVMVSTSVWTGTAMVVGGRPASLFSETGAIGVICFLAVFAVLLKTTAGMSGVNRRFWMTSLAVCAIGAFSFNCDCSQPVWLMFGLLAAHASSLNAEAAVCAEQEQRNAAQSVQLRYA